jgi:nucleotide-binding universal stress UspA family protein
MQTTQKNTILIPLDFSDVAMYALDHAIHVAKHFNNNLALLYVVEEGMLSGLLGKNEKQEQLIKEAATSRMERLSIDIKTQHGIDCSINLRSGKIYKLITDVVEELKCDSVIMGSHGASGIGQLIGSNSSRTIVHSNVPVIVIKSAQTSNIYKNIVFPVDLAIESRQKVKWAIHLGKSYGSTIRLFSFKYNDQLLDAKIEGSLHQIENMLKENGVNYTKYIKENLEENFANETLKYAESIDADLLMIMSQTEDKDFKELVFGAYAQQIVNTSQRIPVMCINPNKIGVTTGWGY